MHHHHHHHVRLLKVDTYAIKHKTIQNVSFEERKDVGNFVVSCVIIFFTIYTVCLFLSAGASCAADDLSLNSMCYRKVHNIGWWFTASNDCLSRGGSLAVFTDIRRPSDNSQLTDWLTASGTSRTYWIGLIRSWQTTDEGIIFTSLFSLVINM